MEFDIEKVYERDIDLYIISKFITDTKFKDLFLNKINCQNYKVCRCVHSYSDENGESDITIIFENDGNKIGILIEDKINAEAMPKQYERYKLRAEKQIKDGLFEKYYIFIIAPEIYLNSNIEAKKYDNKISYEEILRNVSGDLYGETLIKQAIEEKKKGYFVVENKYITSFWEKYYDLIDEKFNVLEITRHNGARGNNSNTPVFLTPIKEVQILHKSSKGYVDLTFPRVSKYYFEVNDIVKDVLKDNMTLQKTRESLAIRIVVPKIDFKGNFEEQKEKVIQSLEAVLELQNLMKRINCAKIMKLSNNKED